MKPFLPLLTLFAGVAHAHHPLDGAMPRTAAEGLLSGLAHPVIGLDHLLFLLAAGAVVGLSRLPLARGGLVLLMFATAGLVGTALRVPGVVLPLLELTIGASLLAAAVCLWRRKSLQFGPALLLSVAAAGFLHGQAHGEAVIGAEPAPVAWYLLGLLFVQCGLLLAVFVLVRRAVWLADPRLRPAVQMLGTAVGAAGVWFMGWALLT